MIKALMKTKKFYEQPLTVVTQVELESPICSGSADIVNGDKTTVGINAHQTNTDFELGISKDATGTNINGWEESALQ